jgi:hypothetical protein
MWADDLTGSNDNDLRAGELRQTLVATAYFFTAMLADDVVGVLGFEIHYA